MGAFRNEAGCMLGITDQKPKWLDRNLKGIDELLFKCEVNNPGEGKLEQNWSYTNSMYTSLWAH